MKSKTLFIFLNPEFDRRQIYGVSKLYQIFYREFNYNIEIVNLDFLKEHIPAEEYSQLLIIAGGDGTIHKIINTIPDAAFDKYIFGIIPGGTANEFAKSLSLPLYIDKAARIAANPKEIFYQHLGIINGECRFATGILYGISSMVLKRTPTIAKHFFGMAAFQFGILRYLMEQLDPWLGAIKKFKLNSKELRTNYLLINNASLASKGVSKGLDSENKNQFSIVYIHSRLKAIDIIRIIFKYHLHFHILQDPALFYGQLQEIYLEFEGIREFLVDGDPYCFDSPLKIELFSKPIAVIVS